MVPGVDRRLRTGPEGGAPLGLCALSHGRAAALQGSAPALFRSPGPLHVLLRLALSRGIVREFYCLQMVKFLFFARFDVGMQPRPIESRQSEESGFHSVLLVSGLNQL